jgi:hypothetical protein
MATAVAKTSKRAAGKAVRGPHCPRCDQQLVEHGTTCAACRKPFQAVAFTPPTRLSRQADSASAESTTCANHDTNLAVDACSRCGAFICALCRMETDELVACPSCLELLDQEGKLASLRKDVINYGYLAAYCSLGAFLIFPLAPLLAIPALLYVRRNLRQNRALNEQIGVGQQRWAVALSVLGVLLGVGFWLFIIFKAGRS